MVRDLQPFDFRPADPRYRQMLDATLGIFDAEEAREVELALRLEAAEALGQAGDSRLERDNWVRIEGGGPARLQPYALARYPVTVQEYRRFMHAGAYRDERWWHADPPSRNPMFTALLTR